MKDCLFCKIIKGEIPSYKIYENEDVYAFLDIADDFEGHTVVIPKKHYESLLDCEANALNKLMQSVQLISRHYVKECGYDGINILNNSGESAHQSVKHLHIHIVPRKNNDNMFMYAKQHKKNSDFQKISQQLKLK